MLLIKLIALTILGLLSAGLSYYRKNYYLRVFDDIIGREEDDNMSVKLGRAFVYGFLFPVYFSLVVAGLIWLAIFLIVAGILAAIIFVLVWLTEKILPHEGIGKVVRTVFERIGLAAPVPRAEPSQPEIPMQSPGAARMSQPATPSPAPPAKEEETGNDQNPFPGGNINRTRVHSLD